MGPTPAPKSMPAYLEIRGGKSAYIEPKKSPNNSHQIVVKSSQHKTSNLTVYKVPNTRDRSFNMAFCFKLRREKYFPVVERDSTTKEIKFKIQAQKKPDIFSKRFLFKWAENNGEYGSLCSVAEPGQFLHVSNKTVTLSAKPDLGFRVKFLDSKNVKIRMLHLQNSRVEEGYKGHTRRAGRRKAVQRGVARGGWKTS